MSTKKYQQQVPVYITSRHIEASGYLGEDDAVWLNLEHYSSKEAFMEAALEAVKAIEGEENPEIMFVENDADNWAKDMITEDNVDGRLWELMLHDDDTVEKLKAWRDCYETDEKTTVDDMIEAAERDYIGKFDSEGELVEYWLDREGLSSEAINTIVPNSDVTAICDIISEEMRFSDGHYFVTK